MFHSLESTDRFGRGAQSFTHYTTVVKEFFRKLWPFSFRLFHGNSPIIIIIIISYLYCRRRWMRKFCERKTEIVIKLIFLGGVKSTKCTCCEIADFLLFEYFLSFWKEIRLISLYKYEIQLMLEQGNSKLWTFSINGIMRMVNCYNECYWKSVLL